MTINDPENLNGVELPRKMDWSSNTSTAAPTASNLDQCDIRLAAKELDSGPIPTNPWEIYEVWPKGIGDCECVPFPGPPLPGERLSAPRVLHHQLSHPKGHTTLTPISNAVRAAWALVVSRITTSKDVVFGEAISCPSAAAGIDVISGRSYTTVPIRINSCGNQTVSEYLKTVQRQAVNMAAFDRAQVENFDKACADARRTCKFQTLLVIQSSESNEIHHTEQDLEIQPHLDTYSLVLRIRFGAEKVTISPHFDSGVIAQWQMRKVVEQLDHVMGQLEQADPNTLLAELAMITSQDLEQIWGWNSLVPASVERCIQSMIEDAAQARPNAPALCAWDGKLTHGELDSLAAKLAGRLVELGIGPDILVPLCFEKSMWTTVAMIGVLKAGGGFVLLDPSLPEQRLETIVRQAKGPLVLSSLGNSELASRLGQEVLIVNSELFADLSDQPTRHILVPSPSSIVYVIFTSGTTGVPKGVMISHTNAASALHHQTRQMAITSESRILDFASYSFDASIKNAFAVLAAGGCLCVPSDADRTDNLERSIISLRANIFDLTPTVAQLLSPETLPEVQSIIFAGEALRFADVERLWGKVEVIHVYGPSECTPASTINCTAKTPEEAVRIGKGAGLVTWIVDASSHNHLLPVGCIGELLLEGPLVGLGYLHSPELTAAAFIEDPSWLVQGAPGRPGRKGRLYKTGDLVRYHEDGSLIFVGRKDAQVKIHGQRVELGEVEHWVHACMPEASQVVAEVILPQGEDSRPTLAAFVQIRDRARGTNEARMLPIPDDVEDRLAKHLPSYMMPAVIFSMDELPIAASGKMDRKRLRQIGTSFSSEQLVEARTAGKSPKRRPTSDAELCLQGIWARVLNIEAREIGLDDTFFRLGGDSITAMKAVGEARKHGRGLTVADIFHHRTLCQVARRTTALVNGTFGAASIPRSHKPGPVEQSFAQGRLWFLEQLHPGLTWYLVTHAMRIRGPLQLPSLKAALLAVESRHETLRTVFRSQAGVSFQEVLPFRPEELAVVDIPPDNENVLHQAIHRDQTTPFDLQTEPGWRVSVYRLSNEDHVLSIVMHHIVSDGWSVDVLRRELAIFYSAAVRGCDPFVELEPLPIQYRDYSEWQNQEDQLDMHQRQLNYWVKQLETGRPAEFLPDKPRPATLSGLAGVQELMIEGVLYDKLQAFCKDREVTLFVVLLATFRAAHFRLTGVSDATIGVDNANRDRWELRDLVGFFVNRQCIRIKIEDETFEQLVQQVHMTMAASFANQDVPFEKIVSKLQRDRDMSRHPLVQTLFTLHSQIDLGNFTFEGVETEPLPPPLTSRCDLEFHVYREQHALRGRILFSTDLYVPESISSLASVFCNLLERGLSEPETAVASLSLFTDDDFASLDGMGLIRLHQTDYPHDSSVVDLFRKQVAASPERVAVKDSCTQFTYFQLDEQSDMLAQWLAQRSLPAESLIGVLATRSCYTIIAFLGILKANLAYLPFDERTPIGRMETILSSMEGHRLILLGREVQPPAIALEGVDFVSITDILIAQDRSHQLPAAAVRKLPSATSLAYVMFTSGSTGKPKGVMVEHRGIVRLVKHNNLSSHLPSSVIMGHLTNIAFDLSTWEIYAALLSGGTVICIESTAVLDTTALAKVFAREDINTVMITPALLKQHLAGCPLTISALDTVYLCGDRADPEDMSTLRKLINGKVLNTYGPTENSVVSTVFYLPEREACVNGVPIGRTLSNSGAYVMDSQLRLVPLGVIGELVVTGDGLARGYTDSQQNIGRFVTVSLGGEQVRAYRTGDYVRYRPSDGELEFFGRMDGQVKIRGYRVELGEIDTVLRGHDCVCDAVSVLQQENGQEARLVSFITIREANSHGRVEVDDAESQLITAWQEHFDADTYTHVADMDPKEIGRDFIGWTSMYDGSHINRAEMNEWLDETMEMMPYGGSADHVLEIGTGSGMVLFNLAEGMQSYVGLDPSERAVDFVTKTAKSIPTLSDKVKMFKASAGDIGRLDTPISPGLVILNSVIQYFPSQEYLFNVVEQILQLESVTTLFFGDVRSYALHRDFLASRALRIAGDNASKSEVRRIIADMERAESELLIDPAFFTNLPSRIPDRINHVEILPKKMHAANELSCYRYTAVLHVRAMGAQHRQVHEVDDNEWVDFMEHGLDRQSLPGLIQDLPPSSIIAVSNIPDKRTIFERCILSSLEKQECEVSDPRAWLSQMRQTAQDYPSLSAVDLVEIARQADCQVEISWARQHSQHGGLDAVFHRHQEGGGEGRVLFRFPVDGQDRPYDSLSSHPLRRQLRRQTLEQLQEILRAKLPSYMMPDAVTILEKIPVNANGKIDRRALEGMRQNRTAERKPVRQPTSQAECLLQKIWANVLNIEASHIGVTDSFFHLGGNSIAAMKIVAEARKVGLEFTVAHIFRHPNLQDLATHAHISVSSNLIAEIDLHDTKIASAQQGSLDLSRAGDGLRPSTSKPLRVFLTGANGYIGTQILRQLLEHGRVCRVIALVRGESATTARKRIIDAARMALWWTEFHNQMLEVWSGDLSLPHLGLDNTNWNRLADGKTVDVIIHSGAAVRMTGSYAALRATNVGSTAELICLAATTPRMRLVYVSNARHQDPCHEQEEDVARELSEANGHASGYRQTKFVAEALVNRAAVRSEAGINQFAVVSLGLVIGTPTEGVANADDSIWPLVAACISAGIYNGDDNKKWIALSDASFAAETIVKTALDGSSSSVVQVKGGMTLEDFWTTLATGGYPLEAVGALAWEAAIREDIEARRETHPLWALAGAIESLRGRAEEQWAASWRENGVSPVRLRVALRKSAEFLCSVGFLPRPMAGGRIAAALDTNESKANGSESPGAVGGSSVS